MKDNHLLEDAFEAEDYSRNPVPEDHTYSGFHIALVIIGGTIGIPVFLMSAKIGGSLGLVSAAPAFMVGCLVLGIGGALTSLAGAKTHLSTYMLSEFSFGRQGAKFVNLIIAVSMIGWYGITCNIFAQSMDVMLRDLWGIAVPLWVYLVAGSVLMVAVSIAGFNGIDKLALALVPAMGAFLVYTAVVSYDPVQTWRAAPVNTNLSFSSAVSAVIGSYIVGVVIQPDYSRFAKNLRHASWAVFFALGISFPLIMLLAAIPGVTTGVDDLIQVMLAIGIGLPAFFMLLLSTWSSNVLSLYSSGLSVATILTRTHLWKITLSIGVIGTALAFLQAQEILVTFMVLLGIAIPPIASIIVINVFLVRGGICDVATLKSERPMCEKAFIAWGMAVLVGYLSQSGYLVLTTVSSLDSILVSSVVYYGLHLFARSYYRILRSPQ